MTEHLKSLDEVIVVPMLTRVWPVATQRHVTQGEVNNASARVIAGTSKVLASVKDVGSFWR